MRFVNPRQFRATRGIMNNKHKTKDDDLFEVIAGLSTKEEARKFFTDLCTAGEITAMSQRLLAAKLLLGGCTYEQVISATDISSATLSRVSKCVKHGEGYSKVLVKDEKKSK